MKKLVSFILVLTIVLGMTVAVAAAAPPSTDTIDSVKSYLSTADSTDITVGDSMTLTFPLSADMFDWRSGTLYASSDAVSNTHISRARVTAAAVNKKGAASAIESVKIVQKSNQSGITGSTAVVEVKFKKTAVTTAEKTYSFTLYLSINGRRDSSYGTDVYGTIYPNIKDTIDDGDYVDISDGSTIYLSRSARNVEMYLGADVTIKLNLAARRRYSGTASYEVSSSDYTLMDKYPDISDVITITQSGLSASGKYVAIDSGNNYYVYNSERQFIGRSSALLPFSSKYYLSSKSIDMGAGSAETTAPASSTASSSSSSSSSSSGAISKDKAVSAAKAALAKNKNASVRYRDAAEIAASSLKAMNDEAVKVGGKVLLNADTMSNGKIMGRLSIPAASADKLSSTIKLGVYTDSKNTSDVKSRFEKNFNNKIAVISMAHKGSFGADVTVIAKPNLSSFNTKSLYLYSYDKSANKYRLLNNTGAAIDKNGYLNFKTSYGGEIIITDSPLKRK